MSPPFHVRLISQVEAFKACRFQGVFFSIETEADVGAALAELVKGNRKVKKATHPTIHAYYIPDAASDQPVQGHDDCGEKGAGRVL